MAKCSKKKSVWRRSDYAPFSRILIRVERVTELEILAPSVHVFNKKEMLVSTEAAEGGMDKCLPHVM